MQKTDRDTIRDFLSLSFFPYFCSSIIKLTLLVEYDII